MRHLAILCAVLGLGGCALIHDTGMDLVATTVPTHAVIDAETFHGTAVLHVDRTGTLHLTSASRPDITCVGRLRYTASSSGVISLHCTQGTSAVLDFVAISESRGHASGRSSSGPVNLTFGLEMPEASGYLKLPNGSRLPDSGAGQPASRPRP